MTATSVPKAPQLDLHDHLQVTVTPEMRDLMVTRFGDLVGRVVYELAHHEQAVLKLDDKGHLIVE